MLYILFCLAMMIPAGIIGLIIQSRGEKKRRAQAIQVFTSQPDFNPTDIHVSPNLLTSCNIAIDSSRNKIAVFGLFKIKELQMYSMNEIVGTELLVDNITAITNNNRFAADRGFSSRLQALQDANVPDSIMFKTHAETIDLKISLNDPAHPKININFLNQKTPTKYPQYAKLFTEAQKWQRMLATLMDNAHAPAQQSNPVSNQTPPDSYGTNFGTPPPITTSGPITDELMRLENLFERGAITSAEYALAKQKLIS